MTWWKPTFTKLWYLTCCACMHEWSVFTFCTPCHFPSSQMSNSCHKTSYFILFINQHPLSTRCMSKKTGQKSKHVSKFQRRKKQPTKALLWQIGPKLNLAKGKTYKKMLRQVSQKKVQVMHLVFPQQVGEIGQNQWKCHGIKLNDLDDMVVVGVKRGDTMPSALKCLIEWVFFNPENLFLFQIVFHFSLLIIFHASNFTCITMDFMLYNDASDVEVMFDIYGNVQCTIIYLYQASIGRYNIGIIYCLDP